MINKSFVIISILMMLSCMPKFTTTLRIIDTFNQNSHEQNSIVGFTTIYSKNESIRSRFIAEKRDHTLNALCMDEMGIPLCAIVDSLSNITIKSHFPPFSKMESYWFALAITSLLDIPILNKDDNSNYIIRNNRLNNHKSYLFITEATIDSIIIINKKNQLFFSFSDSTFLLKSSNNDTLCDGRYRNNI